MRWVVLADDWPPQRGGVASWGFCAAAALAAEGDQVRVFARARPGLVAPPGVVLTPVPGRSFGALGPLWAALRGARALVGADAVLATTWPMAEVLLGVASERSPPVHVVLHGSDLTRLVGREGRLRRVAARSRVWAVSRFLVGEAARHGVDAEWIPSPVSVPATSAWSVDGPWAFVGRATELKGADRLIRLAKRGGRKGLVVGEGPGLEGWRQLAEELEADVRFTGGLDRLAVDQALSGAALVALLPRIHADGSGAEGHGLVLLEAAARGQLPVGVAVGGVPEALGPGLCLDPEAPDAVDRIVGALASWSPDIGRAWVARTHGPERVAKALRA